MEKYELSNIVEIIGDAIENRTFIRAVLSRPADKGTLKASASLFLKNGKLFVQIETLKRDGKALHENIPAANAAVRIADVFVDDPGYGQADILTRNGGCVVMRSKHGRVHIANGITAGTPAGTVSPDDADGTGGENRANGAGVNAGGQNDASADTRNDTLSFARVHETHGRSEHGSDAYVADAHGGNIGGSDNTVSIAGHDREKRHILTGSEEFLHALGISDENGRVIDRRRAKFRQVNRFLELLRDIVPALPDSGLTVCDLCCGRSYLTFAVYWYLTEVLGRSVAMYGVDLKADVIAFCAETAKKLGYSGMSFLCADVSRFDPPEKPDLVISLHACDTATDIVLAKAVKSGARVIMSTPCCHHELNSQLECGELDFILRHSILRQKFSDAATDALRVLRLEAEGYEVSAIELIDPEETPKNVLIRAVKRSDANTDDDANAALLNRYAEACRFLGVTPSIGRFIEN